MVVFYMIPVLCSDCSLARRRPCVPCSCEAEPFSALVDREQQLLPKHLIRRVLRKIDLVEAWCTPIGQQDGSGLHARLDGKNSQVCAWGRRSVSPYALWIEKRWVPWTPCSSTKPPSGTREVPVAKLSTLARSSRLNDLSARQNHTMTGSELV